MKLPNNWPVTDAVEFSKVLDVVTAHTRAVVTISVNGDQNRIDMLFYMGHAILEVTDVMSTIVIYDGNNNIIHCISTFGN